MGSYHQKPFYFQAAQVVGLVVWKPSFICSSKITSAHEVPVDHQGRATHPPLLHKQCWETKWLDGQQETG